MKRTYYEVIHPSGSFAIKCFPTLKEAKADVQYNLDGCPDNTKMSDENRAYWKQHGAKCKIYKVRETTIRNLIK